MKRYCIWVQDTFGDWKKYFGNMKRWQAYYLAFHLWIVMRSAKSKKQIKVEKES